jgi:hypothetical protein
MEPYFYGDILGAEGITYLLARHFPYLPFPAQTRIIDALKKNIEYYFTNEQNKWTPKVEKITKTIKNQSEHLVPSRNTDWTKIIKYFINELNDHFFNEFYESIKNTSLLKDLQDKKIFDKNSVPNMFFAYIKDKDIWELYRLVIHEMRHKPPSVYETFEYYAGRQYALLNFAFKSDLNKGINYLLNEGMKIVIAAIHSKLEKSEIEKIKKLETEHKYRRKIVYIICEMLESGIINLDNFVSKFRSRIPDIYRVNSEEEYDKDDDKYDPFTKGQKGKINKYIEKIIKYIYSKYIIDKYMNVSGHYNDLHDLMTEEGEKLITETLEIVKEKFKEKVFFLFRLINGSYKKEIFFKTQQDTIQLLYHKINNGYINYNKSDKETVNNYMNQIIKYIAGIAIKSLKDSGHRVDLQDLMMEEGEELITETLERVKGRSKAKIRLLFRLQSIKEIFSKKDQDNINELYYKQQPKIFLEDEVRSKNNDGKTQRLADMISNEDTGKEKIDIDEKIMQKSAFENNLKAQFKNEENLETVLNCLPHHFQDYPLDKDKDGKLVMDKKSVNELAYICCIYADKPANDENINLFSVLIQRSIDNLNENR